MNNIPEFPQQTDLTFEHNVTLRSAVTAQGIRAAEYSFYYLTSWYYNRPARISRIADRYVLDVEGKQGGHIFLGPFGTGPIKPAVEKLLEHAANDFGEEKVLHFLPGVLAEAIMAEMTPTRVEEHRDYFDYLYLREELSDLSGRKFQKRRNQLNKIQRENSAEIVPLLEKDIEQIFHCFDRWYEKYGDDDPFLDMEKQSIRRALPNLWKLGGQGIRVKIADNMCGISWAVPISDDTWLVPVEKAAREVKGMYQYVNWALANSLPASAKILNREADLGIEGLRTAKERYNPMGFEKKVTLWFE
ncbi:MAG: DNA polymerase I [Candidatus Rifleibacterium amylolyticum]|nr:MAG: DNA polymerase I [Candidatus Rifleibacterium amylolyticum]